MRSGPVEGAPDRAAGADNFAFRKRLDGGYTIARRNANVAALTPDSFRLFFDFLPALVTQWHELRLRIGRSFLEEWRIPRRWALDAVTPFETVRTLDPAPSRAILDEGERNLVRSFPAFAGMKSPSAGRASSMRRRTAFPSSPRSPPSPASTSPAASQDTASASAPARAISWLIW